MLSHTVKVRPEDTSDADVHREAEQRNELCDFLGLDLFDSAIDITVEDSEEL
eukprot:gene31796-40095_t